MNFPETDIIVLKENKDGYEPDAQQIQAYGQHLGLSLPEDQRFYPMLYEALKAPLPQNWDAVQVADHQDMVFYRHRATGLVYEDHPVDSLYRDKIHKLKAMTADLAFEVIAEQTQSWLKESSDAMRNSKVQAEYGKKSSEQVLIENILEEQSLYQGSDSSLVEESSSRKGSKKIVHSARTYRKKHQKVNKKPKIPIQIQQTLNFQQKLQKLKESLNIYWPRETVNLEKIKSKQVGFLKSQEEINQLEKIQALLNDLDNKKIELENIKREKQRKQEKIKFLKQQ